MNLSRESLTLSTQPSDLVRKVSESYEQTGTLEVGSLVRVLGDPTASLSLTTATAQPMEPEPKSER